MEKKMKTAILILSLSGLVFATGCHAHKPDKVVVVKKPHSKKVVLIDNDHRRTDYRIVYTKPKRQAVCKKHKKHWHCVRH